MKKISDYLHLYLGCDIHESYNNEIGKLIGIDGNINSNPVQVLHKSIWHFKFNEVKPILRPLSDMSEEEADWIIENTNLRQVTMGRQKKDFAIALSERWSANSHVLLYLLSKHFDLFNLIPEGLAIDKTTLK